MSTSFADYKHRRKDITSVIEKLEQSNTTSKKTKDYKDERFYEYKMDDQGNSTQVIRFLPNKNPDVPFTILKYRHFFQSKGKYFIEDCPTTIGKPCPCCSSNKELYSMGDEGIAQTKGRTRVKEYFANILVVKDDANPSNVGRVFLYKFGQSIYDSIMTKMKPEIGDAVDVTDFDNGFDFVLKTHKKMGFVQYDKSYFLASPRPIPEADQERVFNALHDISEFREPSRFKNEKELQERLNSVLNGGAVTKTFEDKVNSEMSKLEESINEPQETSTSEIGDGDIDDLFN